MRFLLSLVLSLASLSMTGINVYAQQSCKGLFDRGSNGPMSSTSYSVSQDGKNVAIVVGSKVNLYSVQTNKLVQSVELKQGLPNAAHLAEPLTQLSWSKDNKTLLVIPKQFENQSSFNYFVIRPGQDGYALKTLNLPKNYRNTDVLGQFSERVIWVPGVNVYGLIVDVKYEGYFRSDRKEVVLFFDSNTHDLKKVAGFESSDKDYRVETIYQNRDNPNLIEVLFYHVQWNDRLLHGIDLATGELLREQSIYGHYSSEGYSPIAFDSNPVRRSPSAPEDPSKPFRFRSPNGKYFLELMANSTIDDKGKVSYKDTWNVRLVKNLLPKESETPGLESSVFNFSSSVPFGELSFFWHKRGNAIVIKADNHQVWAFNAESRIFETQIAENVHVRGDYMFLEYRDDTGVIRFKRYNLLTFDFD